MARGKRIKGITIELDGETKGLDKALQDVNKRSRDLQSELRDVNRLLKFDPGNTEALAQKQRLLSEQVEVTAEKLEKLKQAEKEVQQQFERGDIGEQQYRAFRREIEFTEAELKKFKQELASIDDTKAVTNLKQDFEQVQKEAEEAKDEIKEVGNELVNMLAGAAAAGGVAGVIEKALDTSSLDTKIEISFDINEESKQVIKDTINTISAYGIDAQEALEGIRRQWALNEKASDTTNRIIVEGAAAISAAYAGVDFTELIQEINEISRELNITNHEALGLANALLKTGFPPEQLDTIAEYGAQLRRAGYNAKEIQAIFAAGVDTGTWNIDNLLDGLKEGRILLAEFGAGVDDATIKLLEGTGISATQLQAWGQAVAAGGEQGKKAMQEVAQALANVKDSTKQNELGVKLFGTMWEDQGENILNTILGMNDHLSETANNQSKLNEAIEQLNSDPAIQMEQALADLKLALEPVLLFIAEIISVIAEWIQNNPQLAATIMAIVTALGILLGIFMALSPIVTALSVSATALGVSIGAIVGPVLAVIAAIGSLIAIGVTLYKNWDTIKKKAGETWDWIGQKFQDVADWIGRQVDRIKNFFSNLKIKIPKFKLPHFKLEGKFSLLPPSVPKIKVDWYAQGGLFPPNSPRIIGVGDNKTSPEAVLPLNDKVLGTIGKAIAAHIKGGNGGVVLNIENFTNNTDKDIRTLAQELAFYMKQQGAFD